MTRPNGLYRRGGKRLLDLVLASLALVLLAPVVAAVALIVRLKLGTPVFFRQQRPGLGGRPFSILKFRTMTDERDATGNLLPDEQRIPSVGRLLRTTSLDELPELINVLRGHMSLVGPRPLLPQYLPYYTNREALRLDLRPGLTGWAQINGRSNLGWDERLACDVWYVENCSLWLDLKILAITLWKVVRREDAAADPGQVLPPLDEERAARSADAQAGSEAGPIPVAQTSHLGELPHRRDACAAGKAVLRQRLG